MNTIRNPRSEGDAFLIPQNHFRAVSLSGGKDSTCVLLLMLEREMPIDMVLFADTGMEFPEMYEHLAQLDEHLFRERGIKPLRKRLKSWA